jgi:hypothetical protein
VRYARYFVAGSGPPGCRILLWERDRAPFAVDQHPEGRAPPYNVPCTHACVQQHAMYGFYAAAAAVVSAVMARQICARCQVAQTTACWQAASEHHHVSIQQTIKHRSHTVTVIA